MHNYTKYCPYVICDAFLIFSQIYVLISIFLMTHFTPVNDSSPCKTTVHIDVHIVRDRGIHTDGILLKIQRVLSGSGLSKNRRQKQ